ncbi:hypothetical protein DTO207G8_4828 [Paecilomyces variotii]|nr:hypothetical protein DTO207G8_4828 [Paecilomyces variotii]KAJ9259234.1 hypothetical protein DTO195F2_5051 [Paecilomyces variotii]KAJ9367291.1 hypothetical protein DTO282E5_8007 [Paecilomyces variotii]
MFYKNLLLVLLASTSALNVALAGNNDNDNNDNDDNNDNGGSSSSDLALDPNNVQKGSQSNGLDSSADPGTAASVTDNANFINFCSGKTLTNGQQLKQGSCNGIVMGDIPAQSNMISTIITNPQAMQDIPANQDFQVNLQVDNLQAGTFTNPDNTYYAAPQALQGGKVVGHTHVTIQSLGNDVNTQQPPDATQFAFFKGINDAGDGNGGLSADVAGGLPAGVYRVCTMTSSANHQPVLMPVAQRGAQDDCQKFTVGQSSNNQQNAQNNAGSSTGSSAAKSGQSSQAQGGNSGQGGNNGQGGQGGGFGGFGGFGGGHRGRGRFAVREFIA